ncbi:MAG: 50S ribosomal protein L4 [Candidatus Marinimicrobia bacterium]|nr:50S ribosomal protein L4 [Candidatus Neomarinimicrobiota bacterium]|tara:strand:+ start:981 stop:1607 length:627 start_codon:yes stop_codon:yes gene_type:complete
MKLILKNLQGKELREFDVSKQLIDFDINPGVVRQATLSEMANLRQGTHCSKNRSAVRGGGKKPWKQKGRGAARAGTIRSPLWKGGGVIFGPTPHAYKNKLSKKMSKLARRSVFVDKLSNGNVVVVENFIIDSFKTRSLNGILKLLKIEKSKISLLVEKSNENLNRAVRNLANIYMVKASNVSVYELLDCDVILVDLESFNLLVGMLEK